MPHSYQGFYTRFFGSPSSSGICCFAWNNANTNQTSLTRRDLEAAGALGVMTIASGVIYLVDFFYVAYHHAMFSTSDEF